MERSILYATNRQSGINRDVSYIQPMRVSHFNGYMETPIGVHWALRFAPENGTKTNFYKRAIGRSKPIRIGIKARLIAPIAIFYHSSKTRFSRLPA